MERVHALTGAKDKEQPLKQDEQHTPSSPHLQAQQSTMSSATVKKASIQSLQQQPLNSVSTDRAPKRKRESDVMTEDVYSRIADLSAATVAPKDQDAEIQRVKRKVIKGVLIGRNTETDDLNTQSAAGKAQAVDKDLKIADMEAKISNLDTQLAIEKAEIAHMSAKIANLDTQLANEKTQTTDMATKITSLLSQLANEKKQIVDMATKITNLERLLASEKAQVARKDIKMVGKKAQIAFLESQLNDALRGNENRDESGTGKLL